MSDRNEEMPLSESHAEDVSGAVDASPMPVGGSGQTHPTPTPGGPTSDLADSARRGDSRRYADQNDMLPDDPGDHRFEASEDAERARPSIDWATEVSPSKIGGELRRIEAEVRHILDRHDLKRKRRLAGTRRWHELEEDIIAWRFSPRIDDALLVRLRDLVVRRHHVFQRLRFIASTRPTWNS